MLIVSASILPQTHRQAFNMSSPPAGAQSVNVKVNHFGVTRRFKLNLRDISINTFEDKIREFLHIPAGYPCKIERYSDSAGSYVVLDRSNISVYKQLHRAAKAKAKLKIRVTDIQMTPEPQKPEPASVETEEEAEPEAEPLIEASSSNDSIEKADETTDEKANEKADEEADEEANEKANEPTEAISDSQGQAFTASVCAIAEPQAKHVAQSPPAAPEVPKKDPHDWLTNFNTELDSLSIFSPHYNKEPPKNILEVGTPPISETTRVSPYASLGFGDFRVCCNSCERTIPDSHYHCNKCDDDDFDLCMSCVQSGITCHGADHWMIKRFKRNGIFVTSTTEKLPPKAKAKQPKKESFPDPVKELEELRKKLTDELDIASGFSPAPAKPPVPAYKPLYNIRACNNCVQERPEHHFLHCTTCEDFDLCKSCFAKDNHGHHPKHAFFPAVPNSHVDDNISAKLAPGRNKSHNAICDNCDNFIRGIRHKCLDCPDWDYCNDCMAQGHVKHAGHRFAPIYEPLPERFQFKSRTIHQGICCDGPLCGSNSIVTYISGVRYKCAVCPDTDFCAACEAHPTNTHNKTHPLIMFKTAVRQAVVSTSGFDPNGVAMPPMGDCPAKATQSPKPTLSSPRAVVNVEPLAPVVAKEAEKVVESEPEVQEKEEPKAEPDVKTAVAVPEKKPLSASDLGAVYVRDTIMDGTVLQPNYVFEQTWVLRNSGDVAWPAGCAVKFVGGDYMGHVDSSHPAGISELVSASESTVCYDALEPGQEYPFTVLLRTPPREGKIISYWRLTTPDGLRFGHRLWCDVNVQTPKTVSDVAAIGSDESNKKEEAAVESSQMVFPKLEKESPVASIHQDSPSKEDSPSPSHEAEFDELEEWKGEAEAWVGSEDGFFTDEEYDILDASDEEFLEESKLKAAKK